MRRKITVGRGAGNRPHEQQTEQAQAAHPVQARRHRRATEAAVLRVEAKAKRARARRQRQGAKATGPSGEVAVKAWHTQYVDGLQRVAGKLRIFERLQGVDDILLADADTVRGRKRICIRLAREQALAAGVSYAEWACMTRQERAALVDWRARNIEDHPVAPAGTALAGAFRKIGIRPESFGATA